MKELKNYLMIPLIVIGALNVGIIGAFRVDLIGQIFGAGSIGTRISYVLVGIAAFLYIIDALSSKKK